MHNCYYKYLQNQHMCYVLPCVPSVARACMRVCVRACACVVYTLDCGASTSTLTDLGLDTHLRGHAPAHLTVLVLRGHILGSGVRDPKQLLWSKFWAMDFTVTSQALCCFAIPGPYLHLTLKKSFLACSSSPSFPLNTNLARLSLCFCFFNAKEACILSFSSYLFLGGRGYIGWCSEVTPRSTLRKSFLAGHRGLQRMVRIT